MRNRICIQRSASEWVSGSVFIQLFIYWKVTFPDFSVGKWTPGCCCNLSLFSFRFQWHAQTPLLALSSSPTSQINTEGSILFVISPAPMITKSMKIKQTKRMFTCVCVCERLLLSFFTNLQFFLHSAIVCLGSWMCWICSQHALSGSQWHSPSQQSRFY